MAVVNMVLSCTIDVTTIVVFTPAAVLLWRLHEHTPERWRLVVTAGFVVAVAAVALTIRLSTGRLPVWYLAVYAVMVAAIGYVLWTNTVVLRRNRELLARLNNRR
jgi:hypothetical protein